MTLQTSETFQTKEIFLGGRKKPKGPLYRSWKLGADEGKVWKKVIYDGCKAFEIHRVESFLKQTIRKRNSISIQDSFQPEHVCNIGSWVFLSKVRLSRHMRFHDCKQSQGDFTQVLLQQPAGNSNHFYDRVSASEEGLRGNSFFYHILQQNLQG